VLKRLIFILLCCFAFASAAKGPEYRSLRVNGMGGAFVAVADGKDALHYNPAGLNLMNRMGNFEKNPDMGYMSRKRFEFKFLTVSADLPSDITDVLDVCGAPKMGKIVSKILFFDFGYFGDVEWCPVYQNIMPDDMKYLPDSLEANQNLADSLNRFDRLPIEIGTQISLLEFAMHNFGLAIWANTSAAPYIETGIIVPSFGYEPIQIDAVAQTAVAFSPVDKWSVGVGFKMAKRYTQIGYDFDIDFSDLENPDYQKSLDTLENRWDGFVDDLLTLKDLTFGLDLGVLYQVTRQIRVGTSLRNVFFGKLAGESITPNWSLGAMASPMILQSNSWWGRKVHFALDYVDILNDNLSDMPLAHLNFGAEIEQIIVPAIFKVKAGTGFGGGYPAWNVALGFGGDVIAMRFGSYAEERGTRTGQKEHRFWTGELSVGF